MLKIIKNLSENYLNFLMQSFQKQSSSVLNNIGKCSMQGGAIRKMSLFLNIIGICSLQGGYKNDVIVPKQ